MEVWLSWFEPGPLTSEVNVSGLLHPLPLLVGQRDLRIPALTAVTDVRQTKVYKEAIVADFKERQLWALVDLIYWTSARTEDLYRPYCRL